jgi:dynein heavy chain, axonemal
LWKAEHLSIRLSDKVLGCCESASRSVQQVPTGSVLLQVEHLLMDNDCGTGNGEDGPMTELLFWRQRMAKFNSVTQQLKSKECRVVLGVCNAAKSPEYKAWKELDLKLTDAANESKDNVKFLSTLEKTLEPMYEGTPQDIIDGVAALMDNIRMMHTIARYYSTAERMTTLFVKITNQMITKCKEHIVPDVRKPEKLWNLPKPELISKMQV